MAMGSKAKKRCEAAKALGAAAIWAAIWAATLGAAGGGELELARQALRDGLWDIARIHAMRSDEAGARLVVLESFAKEEKWNDILAALGVWRGPGGAATADADGNEGGNKDGSKDGNEDAFAYYEALALAGRGEKAKANEMLAAAAFKSDEYRKLGTRLRARLAADLGDKSLALKLVRESGFEDADADAKMAAADVFLAAGDKKAAERIWRDVASMTVAPDVSLRAVAVAAANIGDTERLRRISGDAKDAAVRRFALLRLGRLLISDAATFDEGMKAIRAIVRDAPDTEGAMDAARALAEAYLEREAWQEASDMFRDILEIWPDAAKIAGVQESRGWALQRLGLLQEALDAFARAEECASSDNERAAAALAQGDILTDLGRGADAMAKYRRVLERFPDTPSATKLRSVIKGREQEAHGRELYREYRFAEAQEAFEKLAAGSSREAARADFLVALCMYAQRQDREAMERAQRIADSSPQPSVRAEATLWLAKLSFNEERYADSVRLFGEFADAQPGSPRAPDALLWAARAAFSDGDFREAIRVATRLLEKYPSAKCAPHALLVQGEALVELGRFDEAVLVFERALLDGSIAGDARFKAEVLKADALFAMGADNSMRYTEALAAYRAVRLGESLSPGMRLAVSFKIGRTLEKLRRVDEAIDEYYTGVVIAYREGRQRGAQFDDEARAAFSRAAFRLADEYESRGKDFQAMHILELVIASDVPASAEAERRLDRIQTKGKIL